MARKVAGCLSGRADTTRVCRMFPRALPYAAALPRVFQRELQGKAVAVVHGRSFEELGGPGAVVATASGKLTRGRGSRERTIELTNAEGELPARFPNDIVFDAVVLTQGTRA